MKSMPSILFVDILMRMHGQRLKNVGVGFPIWSRSGRSSSARNAVTMRRGLSLPPVPRSVAYDVALVSKNNWWDGSRAFREWVFAEFIGAGMTTNFSLLMCATSPTRRLHSLSRFLSLDCGTPSACEITCVLSHCSQTHVPSLVTYAIQLQEMFSPWFSMNGWSYRRTADWIVVVEGRLTANYRHSPT